MTKFAAELVANPDAISALTDRVATFLAGSGVDARAVHHVALVLDELLTNVATHSEGHAAPVSINLTVCPDQVIGEVVDRGNTFDPRAAPVPDLSGGVAERQIGGLGLLLVQRVTQSLGYERAGNRNRTTFSISRSSNHKV